MRKAAANLETNMDINEPHCQTTRESGAPKRRLFTLIKDIHDNTEASSESHTRFNTLVKRQAAGIKLEDKPSSSQLARLAQNHGVSAGSAIGKSHIKTRNFKS